MVYLVAANHSIRVTVTESVSQRAHKDEQVIVRVGFEKQWLSNASISGLGVIVKIGRKGRTPHKSQF